MRRQSELPDDLERLGHHLEAAVTAAVRRHSRRQSVMSFVGAVVIAVPFALAGAATNLSPGLDSGRRAVETVEAPIATVAPEPPARGFIVRRVPAGYVVPRPSAPCLDVTGCRLPAANPAIRPPRLGRY